MSGGKSTLTADLSHRLCIVRTGVSRKLDLRLRVTEVTPAVDLSGIIIRYMACRLKFRL